MPATLAPLRDLHCFPGVAARARGLALPGPDVKLRLATAPVALGCGSEDAAEMLSGHTPDQVGMPSLKRCG